MLPSINLRNIRRNRLLQHGLFWLLSFYVLSRFFAYGEEVTKVDVIYTLLFHFSLWLAVYPNLLWFIPKYLRQGKYLLYSLLLVVNAVAAVGLNLLTFNYLSDLIFPGYYFIAYYEFWDILQFVVVYIAATTLLKLSKGWFQYLETQRRLSRLEKEKLDAELSALKSQVNPHFLFNSLNNLYSLALDGDQRTPEIILRLSDMMRYLLYETNVPLVPLEKEIQMLRHYVEMQRLRSGENANVEFHVQVANLGQQEIAPLLFLPLVENGFKHGIKGETKDAFIFILLKTEDGHLTFTVENNKGKVDEVETGAFKGVGLENLRRRLELLYPGKHNLIITDGTKTFTAALKLNLP